MALGWKISFCDFFCMLETLYRRCNLVCYFSQLFLLLSAYAEVVFQAKFFQQQIFWYQWIYDWILWKIRRITQTAHSRETVVWHFASHLPELEEKQSIFMDNFFTSLPLLQALSEKGIGCVGTLRSNCVKDCPLSNKDNFSSMEMEALEIKWDKNDIHILKWKDNSVVLPTSNYGSAMPFKDVKR